jgi:hypothetical protein
VPQQCPLVECTDPMPHIVFKGLGRPSKAMSDCLRSRLADAVRDTWMSIPAASSPLPFGGLRTFITISQSSFIVKRMLDLETPELVRRALGDGWKFWETHGERLATRVLSIRSHLLLELEKRREEGKPKRLAGYKAETRARCSAGIEPIRRSRG